MMVYLTLAPEQIRELRQLSHTAAGRVALRALMVLWRAEGLSTLDIAQRLGCDRRSVTPWIERYCTQGAAALDDSPRSGRPKSRLAPELGDTLECLLGDQAAGDPATEQKW